MKALVTGGGGFLGSAIIARLVGRGAGVVNLSRRRYSSLAASVVQHQGDIADRRAVAEAAAECDIVFHVAAKAGIAGRYRGYHRTNVEGTENVLAACRQHGIRRLVYTSSPSVVFDGGDMEGADESAPYPTHYEAHYPRTKAIAEQAVRAANAPDLATVCLRPHLIWGPGDNHLLPRLFARARSGRLRRIGKGSPLVDSTYIDNAADAHLLAADRLMIGAAVAGKVYFITNGEPLPLWDLINRLLGAAGLGPVRKHVPLWLARGAGWALEQLYALLPGEKEPPMTRFLARELSTAHWFSITAARRDLGYEPHVSIAAGLARLAEQLRGQGTTPSA